MGSKATGKDRKTSEGPIRFSSVTSFVNAVLRRIHTGVLPPDGLIRITVASDSSFLDLYSLGRLFAFLRSLQHEGQPSLMFSFETPRGDRIKNLHELGFFRYCDECGFSYDIPDQVGSEKKYQPDLGFSSDEDTGTPERPTQSSHHKRYWKCLVPIREISFSYPGNENEALHKTNDIIEDLSQQIKQALFDKLHVDFSDISTEMGHILFRLFRELILNTLTHSIPNQDESNPCDESNLLVAVVADCETSPSERAHRPGVTFESGQDKFGILVMDYGRGVLNSVESELEVIPHSQLASYNSCVPWEEAFSYIRYEEETLLKSIFRGNLVIRKGRRSEGLNLLSDQISWFRGVLNFRSGRTEIQIAHDPNQGATLQVRPPNLADWRRNNAYYLPGVIASAVLPSHQLQLLSTKRSLKYHAAESYTPPGWSAPEVTVVKDHAKLPEGVFGSQTDVELRRKSELYARDFIEEYEREKLLSEKKIDNCDLFQEVDLFLSRQISVDFLDRLVQELCKATKADEANLLTRIFFSNAQRDVIWMLKLRNCHSFLMMRDTVCLLLDEADEPHFIGVPRISNRMWDVEQALWAVFFNKAVSETFLRNIFKFDDQQMDCLLRVFKEDRSCLFYREEIGGQTIFCAHDIIGKINERRQEHIKSIRDFVVTSPMHSDSVVRLQNRTYVDKVVHFTHFWSNTKRLFDCCKLFMGSARPPPVNTLLGFMHNGDRLVSALQRLTSAEKLIIIDPTNHQAWKHLELDSDYGIVLDSIYPGDEDGYVKDFLSHLDSTYNSQPKFIATFSDFREVGSDGRPLTSFEGVSVYSLINKAGKELDFLPKEVSPKEQSLVYKTFGHCVMPNILSEGEKAQESVTHGSSYSQYSDIELSAEFWHNASTLRIVSPEKTGREIRNILFYENNEKLIENRRTRAFLEEFVSDFIREKLRLQVDVILHPTHSVGGYLEPVPNDVVFSFSRADLM